GGDIPRRAAAYDMPVKSIDGNDLYAVYDTAKEVIAAVRSGGGPYFVEFKTYRWYPHFEADSIPDLRPKDEIEAWKKKCPIICLEKKLLETGVLTRSARQEIENQVMAAIEEAVSYAIASPLPAPEDALADIYSA
ncbi:MAG: thiamine pyrophosphate-dependent enzyme, partial [Dehalococcoidales bacterium]